MTTVLHVVQTTDKCDNFQRKSSSMLTETLWCTRHTQRVAAHHSLMHKYESPGVCEKYLTSADTVGAGYTTTRGVPVFLLRL